MFRLIKWAAIVALVGSILFLNSFCATLNAVEKAEFKKLSLDVISDWEAKPLKDKFGNRMDNHFKERKKSILIWLRSWSQDHIFNSLDEKE
jgi:hypothetical protein